MVRRLIEIEVSEGFEIPEGFIENAEKMIQYGYEVYRRMGEITESERVSKLQATFKREEERMKYKLEEMQERLRQQEEEMKANRRLTGDEILRYMEEGRRQRDGEVSFLQARLEEQRVQKEGEVSQRLVSLMTEIQAYNTYVGASAAQKGSVGEAYVYNYLSQYFPNYDVVDTSKSGTSMSDMYMESKDGKNRILVEVKNVATLTLVDRSKFEYDIQTCGKSGKINGAILYSLNTANINSRWLNIVYHSGIPTIYISNVRGSPEMIRYGIYVMEELIKRNIMYNESRQMDEEHKDFVMTLDQLFRSAEQEVVSLERDRRLLIGLEDQYKERQRRLMGDMDRMRGMMEKYQMDTLREGGEVKVVEGKEDVQRRIMEVIRGSMSGVVGELKQKTLTDLGIKASEIVKAGGIREIRSLMKVSRRIEVDAVEVE